MAMTPIPRDTALAIAKAHTARSELGDPDYKMDFEIVDLVDDEWLFAYRVHGPKEIPPEKQEQFAGAGGFVISSDGTVRDLSVPEFFQTERKANSR